MQALLRVLILCTGNSARSQMAEALLRQMSDGRIDVRSAGTLPRPEVHPMALATLATTFDIVDRQLSPKHVDRFAGERFDYVITVCDNAAETCPVFPGGTERIHWSFPDPAAVEGPADVRQRAFDVTAADIAARLRTWLNDLRS